ncbi:MAG: type 1 periplasmic-binding domain-containing protein, partial [Deferrisomatales bacterium]
FVDEERERLRRERDLGAALGAVEAAPLPDPPVDPQRLAKYKPRPAVDFDAVFLPVGGLEAAQLAPLFPYHDVGGVILLGTRAWNYPTLVEVGREYVEGALFPAETAPGAGGGAELAAAYRRVYGEAPGALEAYAFDAVRLLARSHATLGDDTRLGLRRRLEAVDGADGATGPLRALATGDLAASAKILTVRRGRVEPAR